MTRRYLVGWRDRSLTGEVAFHQYADNMLEAILRLQVVHHFTDGELMFAKEVAG